MPDKDRDQIRKYRIASRAEFGIFAAVAAVGSFGRGDKLLDSPKILLAICLLLCGVSGYIAVQFRRLPRRKRDAPVAFFSEFSVHPYVTFGFFTVLTAVCMVICLI